MTLMLITLMFQDNRKGRPDLIIGGIDISDKLNSWAADTNNFSYSDQRYIYYDLNHNPAEQMLFHYKTKNFLKLIII